MLYSNAQKSNAFEPLKTVTIAESLKVSTLLIENEIKFISSRTLVQCDIDCQHSIITKQGLLWLRNNNNRTEEGCSSEGMQDN